MVIGLGKFINFTLLSWFIPVIVRVPPLDIEAVLKLCNGKLPDADIKGFGVPDAEVLLVTVVTRSVKMFW